MIWYVFHDSGSHESQFQVDIVEASSQVEAIRKVHKKVHKNLGDYEYWCAPAEKVGSVRIFIPQKPSFEVTTPGLDRLQVTVK